MPTTRRQTRRLVNLSTKAFALWTEGLIAEADELIAKAYLVEREIMEKDKIGRHLFAVLWKMCNFAPDMKETLKRLSLLLLCVLSASTATWSQQKREFRGAWIQCVNGQFQGMGTEQMQQTDRKSVV